MKFWIVYLVFWAVYCLVGWFLYVKLLHKPGKSVWQRAIAFLVCGLLLPTTAIFLTHDIAVVSYLKGKYGQGQEMMQINRIVEYPGSVYWEDNVFPGFDSLSRRWMVEHYLDGIHLQALALNADDGKIYLYRAEVGDFVRSTTKLQECRVYSEEFQSIQSEKKIKARKFWPVVDEQSEPSKDKVKRCDEERRRLHDKDVLAIMAEQEVFSDVKDLPELNYRIEFEKSPIPTWHNRYIYGERLKISDLRLGEIVASAEKVVRYYYKLEIDFVGSPRINRYSTAICGPDLFRVTHQTCFLKYKKRHFQILRDRVSEKPEYYFSGLRGLYNGR